MVERPVLLHVAISRVVRGVELDANYEIFWHYTGRTNCKDDVAKKMQWVSFSGVLVCADIRLSADRSTAALQIKGY